MPRTALKKYLVLLGFEDDYGLHVSQRFVDAGKPSEAAEVAARTIASVYAVRQGLTIEVRKISTRSSGVWTARYSNAENARGEWAEDLGDLVVERRPAD